MTTLEIWLLAISLAMDCFTVSITSGIIMRRICWRTFFIMAFFFGLFQAVMPLIGWFAASRFSHLIEDYDHWIAFGLLAFLGGRMIKESFSNEDKRCFDPTKLKVVVTLAIATSIDALAIGISFALRASRSHDLNIHSQSGLSAYLLMYVCPSNVCTSGQASFPVCTAA